MRILVLIHEFPPIGGGGGRVAQDLCQGFVKHNHEVVVLTAHLKGLPREEVLDGVRVVRLPSLRREAFRAKLPAMLGYNLAGLVASLSLIRKWRPDLIHVHFAVPAGPLAWLLSRLTGIPYVLTAHLGDVPGGVPEKTGQWFRYIYPFTPPIWKDAGQVVTVSEFTHQLARRHYPVQMQVIHNGVDLQTLNPGEIRAGNPPQVIFAGRFVEQKNPLQLVRTLAGLQDLPWKCVMLGDGPLRPAVEEEIANQGLADRFQVLGWVTPDEVLEWFRQSDILFMSSLSEGLPVVGVQALGMGLAIVASSVGGCIDLINPEENGYLVQVGDTESYSRALRNLLSDPQRLRDFREASRQKANCFDLTAIVAEYEAVFDAVVPSRTRLPEPSAALAVQKKGK